MIGARWRELLRRVDRRAMPVIIANVGSRAVLLLVHIWVSRALGPSQLGIASTVLTTATLAAVLGDLGLNIIGVREYVLAGASRGAPPLHADVARLTLRVRILPKRRCPRVR